MPKSSFAMGIPRARRQQMVAIAVVLSALVLPACGGTTEPSPVGIGGTWIGDVSDSSGPGRMTWQIEKDASPFAGVLLVTDTYAGYAGKGSVSGTVSGVSVRVSLKIPVGGFDVPFDHCTADMTGDAQLTASTITGTYTGQSSCGGAITNGQFKLTKQ